jgi:hypothetical protein
MEKKEATPQQPGDRSLEGIKSKILVLFVSRKNETRETNYGDTAIPVISSWNIRKSFPSRAEKAVSMDLTGDQGEDSEQVSAQPLTFTITGFKKGSVDDLREHVNVQFAKAVGEVIRNPGDESFSNTIFTYIYGTDIDDEPFQINEPQFPIEAGTHKLINDYLVEKTGSQDMGGLIVVYLASEPDKGRFAKVSINENSGLQWLNDLLRNLMDRDLQAIKMRTVFGVAVAGALVSYLFYRDGKSITEVTGSVQHISQRWVEHEFSKRKESQKVEENERARRGSAAARFNELQDIEKLYAIDEEEGFDPLAWSRNRKENDTSSRPVYTSWSDPDPVGLGSTASPPTTKKKKKKTPKQTKNKKMGGFGSGNKNSNATSYQGF